MEKWGCQNSKIPEPGWWLFFSSHIPKFKIIAPTVGVWANGWNVTLAGLFFFFCNQIFAHASSQNHTNDFYAVWFMGRQSRDIAFLEEQHQTKSFHFFHFSHFYAETPNFGVVNRHFQAQCAKKYCNLHIIKTTTSIPTKFCTRAETNTSAAGCMLSTNCG